MNVDTKFMKFMKEGKEIESAIMEILKKDFAEVESGTVLAALLHVTGALAEEVELPQVIWQQMTASMGSDLPEITEEERRMMH
tara:strand:+ start:8914 stop:9162 length:249 start_codon:yes stop_codon:yes gene_type:complete